MTTHIYSFADQLVAPILNDEKTATVRYDDERTPVPGDLIEAQSREGTTFATLEVVVAARVPAIMALDTIELHNADYDTDDVDALIESLNDYYPSAGIVPPTPVHVIVYQRVS